jgi:hypothetical protein
MENRVLEADAPRDTGNILSVTEAAAAFEEARRAMDNAVRSIFELARSLEFLGDAIGSCHTEARRQLGEWQRIRIGPNESSAARDH